MERHDQQFTPWDRESRPYAPAWAQPPGDHLAPEYPVGTRALRTTPQDRPRSVTVASGALLYLAVTSLLSIPLSFLGRGALVQELLTLQPGLTLAEASAQATGALAVTGVINFLGALLFALMAFKVRDRRPTARYVATGLLALGLLGFVQQLTAGALAAPAAALIGGVNAAVIVVALVALWRPDTTAYYTGKSGR